MDIKNTPLQHTLVGALALALTAALVFWLNITWSTALARVSFFLLFLVLIIGPIMKLKKPSDEASPLLAPWSWRGELGIWFTLIALAHFVVVLVDRPLSELIKIGGAGYALANLLGLVALFWALVLTATSFNRVITFLGIMSWRWLHSLTYVIFYLIVGHLVYFQFFSTYGEVGPDWFGYLAVIMTVVVVALQLSAFVVSVKKYRQSRPVAPDKTTAVNPQV